MPFFARFNQMEDGSDIVWTAQLERIMQSEGEKALCNQILHRESETRYKRFADAVSIPVIVLSTVAGALSASSSSLFGNSSVAPMAIGALSISVGVLNTIGSYFGWSIRATNHKVTSILYGKLHRTLMVELALPRSTRASAKEILRLTRDQIDRLSEISPQIDKVVIEAFKAKYSEYKDIHRPEQVNGLDRIIVYNPDEDDREGITPAPNIPVRTTSGVRVGVVLN